jgi:hypothetical protein
MMSHRAAPFGLAFAALTSVLACGEAFRATDPGGTGGGGGAATSSTGGGASSASASGTGGATVAVSSSAGTGGNCESPSCGACSDAFFAALRDDFEDGATAAMWTPFSDPGTTVQETFGELRILTAIGFNPPKNAGYYTSSVAAFHECAVSVRLLSPAGIGNAAGYVTFFQLRSSTSDTFIGFAIHDGQLQYELIENGNPVDVNAEEYGPNSHAYLRLREEDGQLNWETSADGSEWDIRKKVESPSFLAVSRLHLGAGVTENLQVPSTARFDDVNITP